jgi:hypothetical protein
MKTLALNLGWEKQSAPAVKKVGLKAYMQRQIAAQPSKKK